MSLAMSRNGLLDFLDGIQVRADAAYQIGLFKSNFNPASGDDFDFGDLTECDFTGYARQPLDSWGATHLNGSNFAQMEHPTITWTFGGGAAQDVYGIFVMVIGGGHVIYVERHPSAPINLSVLGDPFAYTPIVVQRVC